MTDRFITVKNQADLPDSVKPFVSFQLADNNVEAVIIKVGEDFIRVVKNGTYSETLKVLTKQPMKSVTKWRVVGSYLGLTDVNEVFDTEAAAKERENEYSQKANWQDTGLSIESFEQLVTDTSL